MSDTKPTRPPTLEVLRTETVAAEVVRVWFGGSDYDRLVDNGMTDKYVKLLVPPTGVTYEDPGDIEGIRAQRPEAEWPKSRTYTIRHWNDQAREIAIDFALHGSAGVAAQWAAAAVAGDRLPVLGPGGAYAPNLDAPWHLIVGDDAALPAIDAALQALPDASVVLGVIELAVPDRISYLDRRFVDSLQVITRGERSALASAVADLPLPEGLGEAFVHGELAEIRTIRLDLLDRGFTKDRLSLSGYWRQGKDEDGFQAEKRAESAAAGGPGSGSRG